MERNIPSNENQRPATKTTLPSKALNSNGRQNKVSQQRIHLHQTSTARYAKGTALRKGRKRAIESGTHAQRK